MPEKFWVTIRVQLEANGATEAENICQDAVQSYKHANIDFVEAEAELAY